jgi:NADPH:quinone reductase-like Zn-dependent oxidoreductase
LTGLPVSEEQAMKAIVQDTYGSVAQLHLRDVDHPAPAADEVLVRVHSAGVSRGTAHLMTGEPYLMRLMGFGLRAPRAPVVGQDVAGTVVAVGADVTRFGVGDEVFGIAKGSFAEYAAAREDKLAIKPPSLTFDQAAAIGISGLTALRAVDVARVEAGRSVLVIGASGGVGTYAVQIALAKGATVTGVCSTSKVDLVTSLGATRVIDYSAEDFADGTQRYDVVLDVGGMSPVSRLRRALAPNGTLVIVGGESGSTWSPGLGRQLHALALSPFVGQRLTMAMNKEHYTGLERLAELAADGRLTSVIERSYPLAQAPDAIRHLEEGKARGKVVLSILPLTGAVPEASADVLPVDLP